MKDYIISAHLIPIIFKFCGKEFAFPNPAHKEVVAFPELEIKNLFIGDPFQFSLGRIGQFAAELRRNKDEDIPIIPLEIWEHQ